MSLHYLLTPPPLYPPMRRPGDLTIAMYNDTDLPYSSWSDQSQLSATLDLFLVCTVVCMYA